MGFWDRIEAVVVLTPDLTQVLNIQFMDQKETPGLGARIEVPLLEGKASLRLQPGTQSGQRLRLRGKGYPRRGGGQGDLYVRVRIEVPKDLSARERELFEALARASTFRPRRW